MPHGLSSTMTNWHALLVREFHSSVLHGLWEESKKCLLQKQMSFLVCNLVVKPPSIQLEFHVQTKPEVRSAL